MTTKEKLRQYIDFKHISMSEFGRKIDVSESFLRTKGSIMTDKLVSIRKIFRDLNMDWLLFDEGDMIKTAQNYALNEPESGYGLQKEIQYLKDLVKAKDETIAVLREQRGFIKEGSGKAS